MLRFLISFMPVVGELARLLGVRFVPGEAANDVPLGRSLTRVVQLLNAGKQNEAEWEAQRIGFLVKWLSEIEAIDPDLVPRLAAKLLVDDLAAYLGARHEIATAASLVRKGVPFEYDHYNRPDFVVTTDLGEIGIECTSAHVAASTATPDVYVVEPTEAGSRGCPARRGISWRRSRCDGQTLRTIAASLVGV